MDDRTIGRTLRMLRRRLGLRQLDVATRAGVSQQLISQIEQGHCATIGRDTLRRVLRAVDADAVTVVRWRGGDLDRLLDEDHAALEGRVASLLRRHGWVVWTEVTFAEYGERGSIDVLAWHASTQTLLVIEVKTELTSAEALLRSHDAKVRLAPRIASSRFAVRPRTVCRLLVVADSGANRRRLDRLSDSVGATYPARGSSVRRWLVDPEGPLDGAIFMSVTRQRVGGGHRVRVRAA